jgi:hypothetical protein
MRGAAVNVDLVDKRSMSDKLQFVVLASCSLMCPTKKMFHAKSQSTPRRGVGFSFAFFAALRGIP